MHCGFQIPTGLELEVLRKCSYCLKMLFWIIFREVKLMSAPKICDIKECFKSFIKLHLSPKLTSPVCFFFFLVFLYKLRIITFVILQYLWFILRGSLKINTVGKSNYLYKHQQTHTHTHITKPKRNNKPKQI